MWSSRFCLNFGSSKLCTLSQPLSEVSLSENEVDPMKGGLRFHRSVSMGTNGVPWAKAGCDGRIIMMRRRNNSSSENLGGIGIPVFIWLFSENVHNIQKKVYLTNCFCF